MNCLNLKHLFLITFLLSFSLCAKAEKFGNNKLSQTITFNKINDKTCSDSVLILFAQSSSGLPVSFQLLAGQASLQGNLLTILGTGTIVIAASQAGDDIYAPAAQVIQSFNVNSSFLASNNFTISFKRNYCEGDEMLLSVSSLPGLTYRWKDPSQNIIKSNVYSLKNVSTVNSGFYKVTVNEGKCYFLNDSVSIKVNPKPLVSILGYNPEMFYSSPPAILNLLPASGTLTGTGVVNNFFYPTVAGIGDHEINYSYIAQGCTAVTRAIITVLPDQKSVIKIYELITSRHGSSHNRWKIENIEFYPDNEVSVFNEWGDIVYRAKSYTNEKGWDAEGVPPGGYLYIVKLEGENKIYNGKLLIIK